MIGSMVVLFPLFGPAFVGFVLQCLRMNHLSIFGEDHVLAPELDHRLDDHTSTPLCLPDCMARCRRAHVVVVPVGIYHVLDDHGKPGAERIVEIELHEGHVEASWRTTEACNHLAPSADELLMVTRARYR